MTILIRLNLALSNGCSKLMLEDDSLVTIMAINQLFLGSFAIIISNKQLKFQHF